MFVFINLFIYVVIIQSAPTENNDTVSTTENLGTMHTTSKPVPNLTTRHTRRILRGREVGETKPYMVYLRGAPNAEAKIHNSNWLCGGVIIHERYVLTSAACIEDAKYLYIISGTSKWYPASERNNECINNGAKKAVWKCVPKAYVFDGNDFDNIRWMVGDIAVVKTEESFNFERRIRGCDFIPKKVDFNNRSLDLEKAGTPASVAGWGSRLTFSDGRQSDNNSPTLLETDVVIISKKSCKMRWEPRYSYIIEEHMICSKDVAEEETMNIVCQDRDVNCKDMVYSEETKDPIVDPDIEVRRRMVPDPTNLTVHTAAHFDETRRSNKILAGGFCENDHGGPLIVGQGKSSVVVGIMSACLSKDVTKKCYGPFLYTSVYRYRTLISCAIDKDIGPACRKLLRSSKTPMVETFFDWRSRPDDELGFNENHDHQVRNYETQPPTTQKPKPVHAVHAIAKKHTVEFMKKL